MSSGHPLKLNPSTFNRREFIRTSAVVSGSLMFAGCATAGTPKPRKLSANDKLNIACMGCGGKGASDMGEFFNAGENIVALCDTNQANLDAAAKKIREKNPDVKLYRDYRKLLDEMGNTVDAVTVSTPDHMHAPISLAALELGKHVYCQKPLTWCITESRALQKAAKNAGVITQMGNQGSGNEGLRRGIELVQAGIIGEVREIQAWTNRPVWPQGFDRPTGADAIPDTLSWDLWLGVAPKRDFKKDVYTPFKWRGFKDFGCGALGDMACHLWNFFFRALKLGYPTSVVAENSDNFADTFPGKGKVTFQFPARGDMPPLKLVWYEGGWKPELGQVQDVADLNGGQLPNNGVFLIGSKGTIFQADDYGANIYIKLKDDARLRPYAKHEATAAVPVTLPRTKNHYTEWSEACKGGPAPFSSFDIAGYLTETILIGCVAQRFDKQLLEWDGPNMKVKNFAAAQEFIGRNYRKGW